MADERTRYSDAELEEFKQLILKKLENARADYELLRATITHTADNDTEDTSPTFKVLAIWKWPSCVLKIRLTASVKPRASSFPRSA